MSHFVRFGSLPIGTVFVTSEGRWRKVKQCDCLGSIHNALSTEDRRSLDFAYFDDAFLVQVNHGGADILQFPSQTPVTHERTDRGV